MTHIQVQTQAVHNEGVELVHIDDVGVTLYNSSYHYWGKQGSHLLILLMKDMDDCKKTWWIICSIC